MSDVSILASGFAVGESPRWHDGRLWLSNWGTHEVVAIDMAGRSEVMAQVPVTIAFSIDWLPDDRLVIVAGPDERLLRQEPDGTFVDHADMSGLGAGGLNEIVVDGLGNIYVNGGCEFDPPEGTAPGIIALVTPDGSVRQVADEIAFPNGMAVTPDNSTLIIAESHGHRLTAFDIADDGSLSNRRVWADLGDGYPDGICLDAEGAVWYGDVAHEHCVRVSEGGTVLQTIDLDRGCFACMLGGPDGTTLFMAAAKWRGLETLTSSVPTGMVFTAAAPAPGAGWP
jgi:sugar lactone lactonase YvrE